MSKTNDTMHAINGVLGITEENILIQKLKDT